MLVDEFEKNTRKSRYEKKRTNTKAIGWLSILGGILVVVIIALIVFGGNDNTATNSNSADSIEIDEVDEDEEEISDNSQSNNEENRSDNQLEVREKEEDDSQSTNEENKEDPSQESDSDPAEVESDDPNVASAYQDSWQPVGTSQSEPHTTNYNDGSQDREEMSLAVEQALGIAPENQVTWWAGRAGDQAVEVTVSPDSNQNETYRVQLQWVENEGWQPILVEELIENDKN